jgi:hypothetical protein
MEAFSEVEWPLATKDDVEDSGFEEGSEDENDDDEEEDLEQFKALGRIAMDRILIRHGVWLAF